MNCVASYITAMGTTVMLLCIIGQLLYWDIQLKLLQTLSRPLARRYLEGRVPFMAHRLLVITCHYGGLNVDLDRNLVTSVPSPTLVCSNHQSVADIVVLLDALNQHRIRFVAKKELSRGFPAVSEVLRIQRHALIDRTGDYRSGVRQLHRLGRETSEQVSPVVFPEGTRSRTGAVKKFHPGAIRTILSKATIPITAVAVDGGHQIASVKDLVKGLSKVVYRARLVGLYHHDGSKQSIVHAIEQAQQAVTDQINAWRRDDSHRGG